MVFRLATIIPLLLPVLLPGQVVNIENRRMAGDTTRWSAQAGFKLNVTENTQRSLSIGANGGIQYVQGRHRAFLITDFTMDRVENNAFRNTGFQHLRYNRTLSGPWVAEAFAQLQYNKPLRIDERWLLGVGPRYVVRPSDALRLAAGTAVMMEYEEDRVNDLYHFDARNSNYISFAYKMEPHLQFTFIMYYQPKIGDIRDHRISLEGQLRLRASRRLAFDTRLNLQRDTRMAPGIPELNYTWENIFTLLF